MNLHTQALDLTLVRPDDQRRLHRRYRVAIDVTYQLMAKGRIIESGSGRTVDMSSSGILMTTEKVLPTGAQIKLFVAWPAKLNHQTALNLYVLGRILRSDGNCTAITIRHHEFRTRRTEPDDLARREAWTPRLAAAAPVRILPAENGKAASAV
jgi:hypothetical protein